MKSDESITFEESSWGVIEPLLPEDEDIKRTILDDFMWFMGQKKRYSNILQKVDDYVRHLKLKQRSFMHVLKIDSEVFKKIDIDLINEKLRSEYSKLD